MPQVSFGNAGHRGVTHLVAVGDTEDALTYSTQKAVSLGGLIVMGLGAVTRSKALYWGGAGVAGGLVLARWWRSRSQVEVSQPVSHW